MPIISGNSVLILGYGREGQSVHRFLISRMPDLKIAVADKNPPKSFISKPEAVYPDPVDVYADILDKYDTIIRSPGIPIKLPQLISSAGNGKFITSATNLFFENCPGTIIGVTGTKGKSTTSSLIHAVLKTSLPDVRLVGNIGMPALDHLDNSSKNTVFVMELSSYQLEDCRYSPRVAVVLAMYPEHLDHYHTVNDYYLAKSRIVKFQTSRDAVIYDADNPLTVSLVSTGKSQKIPILMENKKYPAFLKEITNPLLGEANLKNIFCAMATGEIFRVPQNLIVQAISTFKPLSHRLEYAGLKNGIKFYNDSLATIPQATISALKALGKEVQTLITGGYDRGLNYADLGQFIVKCPHIKNIILFPTTGEKIWTAVITANGGHNPGLNMFEVNDMPNAFELAVKYTKSGKICLLSPASASFNLFKDYEDRGNQFKKLVQS